MDETEEMGLLTQVPSQQRISQMQEDSSSDEEFHGFNLKPAADLISCTANEKSDFGDFVADIVDDGVYSSANTEVSNENLTSSPLLFQDDTQENNAGSSTVNVEVNFRIFCACIACILIFKSMHL